MLASIFFPVDTFGFATMMSKAVYASSLSPTLAWKLAIPKSASRTSVSPWFCSASSSAAFSAASSSAFAALAFQWRAEAR